VIGTFPQARREKAGFGNPLERLLHALNQPLTGLQCAMEVALASPRTSEQYVQGLREWLELTERMRALVETIREVVDGAQAQAEKKDTDQNAESIDLRALLREVLEDLKPVAESMGVRITLDCSGASSLMMAAGRQRLGGVAFRCVESILSLADVGSELRIDAGNEPQEKMSQEDSRRENMTDGWIRLRWYAAAPRAEFSRAELGLLVGQSGWEQAGATWEREGRENLESVTVRLPRIAAG
jgi:light-regulated signal transduction histidine kinase (bacteriophytochrome)